MKAQLKAQQPKVAPRENPLVPFALMKRVYAGMAESQMLEVWLAKGRGDGKQSSTAGQDACRAAVLLNLEAGDFVLDGEGAASSAWLRGAPLEEAAAGRGPGMLPSLGEASEDLALAIGAAVAAKADGRGQVVVIFVGAPVKKRSLRSSWRLAALHELPMLFVVPPAVGREASAKSISAEVTRDGVPGIPVAANDAVAICRVAQESLLRARAGGGPALLECLPIEEGKRASGPIFAMGKALLRVGACDQAWLDGVARAFRDRLKTLKRERPA